MDVKICRVYLETSEPMANIFDGIPDKRISIADMISQCTGFRVSRGDLFPKTICSPCKEDATNAYEIKQLYETSHRARLKRIYRKSRTYWRKKSAKSVKKEEIEKKTVEKGVSRDEFHGQVKNEPIEEDIFEKDHLISDHHVDFQVKAEEINDYARQDD